MQRSQLVRVSGSRTLSFHLMMSLESCPTIFTLQTCLTPSHLTQFAEIGCCLFWPTSWHWDPPWKLTSTASLWSNRSGFNPTTIEVTNCSHSDSLLTPTSHTAYYVVLPWDTTVTAVVSYDWAFFRSHLWAARPARHLELVKNGPKRRGPLEQNSIIPLPLPGTGFDAEKLLAKLLN